MIKRNPLLIHNIHMVGVFGGHPRRGGNRMNKNKDLIHLGIHSRGDKGRGNLIGILENDEDNVVAEVAFSFELLGVMGVEGKEGGDMEHNLEVFVGGVEGMGTGGIVSIKMRWEGEKRKSYPKT